MITHILELGPTLSDVRSNTTEISTFNTALHDIDHVRAKFPVASESLIERLGRANWERRRYLLDLTTGSEVHEGDHSLHESIEPVLRAIGLDLSDSESDADTIDEHNRDGSNDHDYGSETTMGLSSSGYSADTTNETLPTFSPAHTEATVVASLCPNVQIRYSIPRPPPPNQSFTGAPFRCPFCTRTIIGVISQSEWRHVDSCPILIPLSRLANRSQKTYLSRHEAVRLYLH